MEGGTVWSCVPTKMATSFLICDKALDSELSCHAAIMLSTLCTCPEWLKTL